MRRISDDLLLTHLEVALAVAPEQTLVRLNADDPRVQRGARVDLARHLVERFDFSHGGGRGRRPGDTGDQRDVRQIDACRPISA